MFTNCEGCTIYEKTVVNRAPVYIRHTTTGPIYWQPDEGQMDGKDKKPQKKVFVNMPATSVDYVPKVDDRVVCGIINDTAPPPDALTVDNVKDLRYGSPRVQHIEMILC